MNCIMIFAALVCSDPSEDLARSNDPEGWVSARSQRPAVTPLSVSDAIAMYEVACRSIRSYDILIRCTMSDLTKTVKNQRTATIPTVRKLTELENATRHRGLFRQVCKTVLGDPFIGKLRMEELDLISGTQQTVSTFDGARMRSITFSQQGDYGGITEPELTDYVHGTTLLGADYPSFYQSIWDGMDIVRVLKARTEKTILVAADGSVTIDAPPTKLDVYGFPSYGLRVALAPQHGMLPSHIESYQVKEGKREPYSSTEITKFHKLDDGVWVPVKSDQCLFGFGNLQGEKVLTSSSDVELDVSQWNHEPDDDEFHLTFPVGTQVTDLVRRVQFTTGDSDPGDHMEELIQNARDIVALDDSAQAKLAQFNRKSSLRQIILFTIGLACLVLLVSVSILIVRQKGMR